MSDQPVPVETTGWISWRAEVVTAVVVILAVAALGGAVGLIWHAVAPHVDVPAAINNPEEHTKALMGDDLWLALLGIIAGVLCGVVLFVLSPTVAEGPGALVGLVAGGFLAMLVADRVGYLVGVDSLRHTLNAAFPHATPKGIDGVVSLLDFRVRATAMLLTWPVASLLVTAITTWSRAVKQPTVGGVAAYPGSP